MGKEKKHIEVLPYDPGWPKRFEDEAASLTHILGDACLEVHHIGSTAVPGLIAKPAIDIVCVVDRLDHSLQLQKWGYCFKGELNIPLRYYYSKETSNTQVHLHVVERGHPFLALNLAFRYYLREHKEARDEYAELKKKLLEDPSSYEKIDNQFPGYTLGKDKWIKKTLKKTGFDGLYICFCLHDKEWEEYHRILEGQTSKKAESLSEPDHFHIVYYKGITIIGAAHIEKYSDTDCTLRVLAIDAPYHGMGYEALFLQNVDKWLTQKKLIRSS